MLRSLFVLACLISCLVISQSAFADKKIAKESAVSSKAYGVRNCFDPVWDPYQGCSVDCGGFICYIKDLWEKACSESSLSGDPLEFIPGAHPPIYEALVGGLPAECYRAVEGVN